MEWLTAVDFYCERLQPGFGAEPFNTLTGLAFMAVGLRSLWYGPFGDDRRAGAALAMVGIASAAQHGFAVGATLWADILANLLYLVFLGILMLRRLVGAGVMAAAAGALATVGLGQVMQAPALAARLGLASDIFALLLMVLLAAALVLRQRHQASSARIATAAAVLALGLPFRFLDAGLCAVWPLGTHGIWHLLNATAMALLLSALARHRQVV